MRLSVLDQSPSAEGSTPAQALHNTVDLGRHAEALGYERYWLAEHHATPALAYLETRERPAGGTGGRRAIVGSPTTVRTGLEGVAEEYGTDPRSSG